MSEKTPGSEEYKPSRLEWLAVMANSIIQAMDPRGINSFFLAKDDGKTLVLVVMYHADVPEEYLDVYVDRAKRFAQAISETYGWDSWIEVKTDLNKVDPQKSQQLEEIP